MTRGCSTQNCTWSEPQEHWLPISRAVFRFAIAHTEGQQSAETYQDDQNPFSIESFEKFKSRRDNASADVVDNETNPLSLHNLTRTLRDEAHADQVESDMDGNFMFMFNPPSGGSSVFSVFPRSLGLQRNPVKIDPQLELEALFNKGNGLVLVNDEEAKQSDQQYKAARAAVSLVWNQLLLPDFARSVSAGRINLFARVESRTATFRQLPADLWPN
jgi:hypothetical protein